MNGWSAHLGDDPAYASQNFDDSAWPVISMTRAAFPDTLMQGRSRWFRKHIVLPSDSGPIDLLLTSLSGSYEVYVDGRLVSPPIGSSLSWRKAVTSIYPLRTAADPNLREVEVAIRSHIRVTPFTGTLRFYFAAIASPPVAEAEKTASDGAVLGARIFNLAVNIVLLIAGLLLLTLYLQQPGHREYFWLGVSLLCMGLDGAGTSLEYFFTISANSLFCDPATYWAIAAELQFVYSFVGRKPHRAVRIYQIVLVLFPLIFNPLAWNGVFSPGSFVWYENGLTLPGIILLVALLTVWTLDRNREAAILLGPMLMALAGGFLLDVEIALRYLHPSYEGIPPLRLGLVQITYWPASEALFLVAVGLVIFLRFVDAAREQVRVQSEMEAARIVQNVLIPEEVPAVPGFAFQSVYKPASEVGGDFYQIAPIANGGVLVIIGDVSGKGMAAAMTVSLLVGTFRTLVHYTESPAEILAAMNMRMMARSHGGFTTCLVLHAHRDGALTIANAGHIAPYLAGRELSIENGLPLGLSAASTYAESAFHLEPGEQITLITDGVVEARDKSGALFGFERTAGISVQSAEMIAETARIFGQADDITALTLIATATPQPALA